MSGKDLLKGASENAHKAAGETAGRLRLLGGSIGCLLALILLLLAIFAPNPAPG